MQPSEQKTDLRRIARLFRPHRARLGAVLGLIIVSAGLAVYAALARDPTVVPVLVVVSLLGFVGSVSVARYIGGMLLESAAEGQDADRPRAAEEDRT